MKGDPELRKEREVIENKADEERISKSHANAVKKTEERRKGPLKVIVE